MTELVALGSGSKKARERILVLRYDTRTHAVGLLRIVDARSLYATLHENTAFSGSELNLEGVVARDDDVLLFQRGNGEARDGLTPVNAVARLSRAALDTYLAAEGATAPPAIRDVVHYDLGESDGVPYTFTDATLSPRGTLVFLASAEDSSSAVTDGTVHGTLLGEIGADGSARVAPLVDEQGAPARVKAEGIVLDPHDAARAFLVVDMDDPALPSELLEVVIDWGSG